ncbi:MFS transporter [bacteria symbiont BFo1 of Frankliniella occidentalis]|jgi:MFS family permease|uniref:MFS transporter n=1 Tax=Erwinia aphidicola TaxID=68334 RepID=A0ABU8DFB7_ERWAP|nr:MFS transporter [Erwinia aphidicola]KMV71748.1 MFS transporter [bacteria symbiont BFo1 of Frankliniella occidentalis]KYP91305.1 MFS transporter [bacteria symbiont BFo1 of Frankliniella occidentalis]CAH0204959.1 Putative metabolite transport protein NicT [Erwinia aphidicola]
MNSSATVQPQITAADDREETIWRRAVWRILPILTVSYIFAYLDRINVGIAKLQMSSDLAFSETVYGLGAGIFFIGFFFFQIPSNMALHRFGARRLLAALLISWAVIAPLTALVATPFQFYAVRFLLGLTESGFYPGVILYLSLWFPSYRRGKMFALFAAAVPLSGLLGGPISGWIMEYFHNVQGIAGWKWLFIIQGTPSLLIGLLVFWLLPDRIDTAHWLNSEEKALIAERLREDAVQEPAGAQASLGAVLRNGKLWLLTFIYFCLIAGFYTVSFWLPTLVRNAGVEDVFTVGLLTAIPYAAAIVTMIVASRSADKHRERRWHLALIAVMSGMGMVISALYSDNLWVAMFGLTLGAAGGLSTLPLFWSLPTAFLGGTMAAVGIALINSFGNLAGFVAPYMMGILTDLTHSTLTGMMIISCTLFVGAAAIFLIPGRIVNR